MGSLFNYYHINDLHVVIEALKAADAFYCNILMEICKHWGIPFNLNVASGKVELSNQSASWSMHMKTEYTAPYPSSAPFPSSEAFLDKNQSADQRKYAETSPIPPVGQEFFQGERRLDSEIMTESPCVVSEVSADTTKMRSTTDDDPVAHGLYDSSRSDGALNQPGIVEDLHPVSHSSLRSSRSDTSRKMNLTCTGIGNTALAMSNGSIATSGMPWGTDYINYYSFARTASLVAEELIRKLPDKVNKSIILSEEDLISEQAKIIIKKSMNFYWPSSQNVNAAAQKEKCGWCFTCKVENDDRDCLVNTLVTPIRKASKSDLVGLQLKNQNAHLRDIISYILSLEDRLRGLLLGPWLSLHHSRNWRNNLLKASDVASIKCSLLTVRIYFLCLPVTCCKIYLSIISRDLIMFSLLFMMIFFT